MDLSRNHEILDTTVLLDEIATVRPGSSASGHDVLGALDDARRARGGVPSCPPESSPQQP